VPCIFSCDFPKVAAITNLKITNGLDYVSIVLSMTENKVYGIIIKVENF
jgi:hypothetical protein